MKRGNVQLAACLLILMAFGAVMGGIYIGGFVAFYRGYYTRGEVAVCAFVSAVIGAALGLGFHLWITRPRIPRHR